MDALQGAKLYIDVIFRGVTKQTKLLAKVVNETLEKLNYKGDIASKNLFHNLLTATKHLEYKKEVLEKNNKLLLDEARYVNTLKNKLGLTRKEMQRIAHTQKRFNFDFLTFIFAGMMLKRVFGGALKSIIDGYKKITGLNSAFTKATLKLSAGFDYLKFAIGNALNSPAIINAIEWLTDMFENIGNFLSEHPGITNFLLAFTGFMFALGSVSMMIGGIKQLMMLFTSMKALGDSKSLLKVPSLFKNIWFWVVLAGLGIGMFVNKVAKKYSTQDSGFSSFLSDVLGDLEEFVNKWKTKIAEFTNTSPVMQKGLIVIQGFFKALLSEIKLSIRSFLLYIDYTFIKIKKVLDIIHYLKKGNISGAYEIYKDYKSLTQEYGFKSYWLSDEKIHKYMDEITTAKEMMFNPSKFLKKQVEETAGTTGLTDEEFNKWFADWKVSIDTYFAPTKDTFTNVANSLSGVNTELTDFKKYSENSDELFTKEQKKWEELAKKVSSLKNELNKINGMNVTYTTTHIIKTVYEGSKSTTLQ